MQHFEPIAQRESQVQEQEKVQKTELEDGELPVKETESTTTMLRRLMLACLGEYSLNNEAEGGINWLAI